jgi:hypothetical protein
MGRVRATSASTLTMRTTTCTCTRVDNLTRRDMRPTPVFGVPMKPKTTPAFGVSVREVRSTPTFGALKLKD